MMTKPRGITKDKKKDVLKLLKYLPDHHRPYFEKMTVSKVPDRNEAYGHELVDAYENDNII